MNPVTSLTTERHLTIWVALVTSADVKSYQMNVKRVKQNNTCSICIYIIKAFIIKVFYLTAYRYFKW